MGGCQDQIYALGCRDGGGVLRTSDENSWKATTGLLRTYTNAVAERPKEGNEFNRYLDQGINRT